MINLLCFCGKSRPAYNFDGLSANFCLQCKTYDMINVNDKKCFCAKCRKSEMIDVYSNRCACGKALMRVLTMTA
jgi:hypothetical protein